MALEQNLIRLELDVTQYAMPGALVNLFTGMEPVLARSRAHRIEIVVLKNGVLDGDVANFSSITVEVKAYQSPSSAPLISVTQATVTVITEAARTNRTDQHAVVAFTEGQTGLDMVGADADGFKNFNMVITGVRAGKTVTLGWGKIRMLNDGGVYSGNTPIAGDPTYFTKEETSGLLASYARLGLNPAGKGIILQGPNGHKWMLAVDANGQLISRQAGP